MSLDTSTASSTRVSAGSYGVTPSTFQRVCLHNLVMPRCLLTLATELIFNINYLGADQASPALRRVFADLAARTMGLLDAGGVLPRQVADFRLALETAVIVALARHLTATLVTHDPLSERVHHNKLEYLRIGGAGAARTALGRLFRPAARPSARMGRA